MRQVFGIITNMKKSSKPKPNHHKSGVSFSYHGMGWVATIHKADEGPGFVVKVSYGENQRCFFKQQFRAGTFNLAEKHLSQMVLYNCLVSVQPVPEELAKLIAWNFKDPTAIKQMSDLLQNKKLELSYKLAITVA